MIKIMNYLSLLKKGLSKQIFKNQFCLHKFNNYAHLEGFIDLIIKELLNGGIQMNHNEIIEFLLKAKKATYAGKGPEMKPWRPDSHDLKYAENGLLYIDTYLGGEKFAGEEALWQNEKPIWVMNYCGRVIGIGFDGDFLKEALANVMADKPFRGPEEYKKGDYIYKCTVDGDFEWFSGLEKIFKGNQVIYECMFHGGLVK